MKAAAPRKNKRGDAARAGAEMLRLMRRIARVRAVLRSTSTRVGYAPYDALASVCEDYLCHVVPVVQALSVSAHDDCAGRRAKAWADVSLWSRRLDHFERLIETMQAEEAARAAR